MPGSLRPAVDRAGAPTFGGRSGAGLGDHLEAKAQPSPAAQRKAARKRTDPAYGEPLPVNSFHTLLPHLVTSASGKVTPPDAIICLNS